MSKLIQEKNDIFALYKKSMYISEIYSPALKPPMLMQHTLIDDQE